MDRERVREKMEEYVLVPCMNHLWVVLTDVAQAYQVYRATGAEGLGIGNGDGGHWWMIPHTKQRWGWVAMRLRM